MTSSPVLQLLDRLGVFQESDGHAALSRRDLEQFDQRTVGFDWVHMGSSDLALAELFAAIRSVPELSPPRSGHMGNWFDVVRASAGMLDYNRAILGSGLGYPLIYPFNQTEDVGSDKGDWIYLPGSEIRHGKRRLLPLHTWDGAQFVERDRSLALFTPFVATPLRGELVPLIALHTATLVELSEYRFRSVATILDQRVDQVREVMTVLLEEARLGAGSAERLDAMVDREVTLDGQVSRIALVPDGQGFRMGDVRYATTAALIDALLIPVAAAARPAWFVAHIRELPPRLPLLSLVIVNLLYAILDTHYPEGALDRRSFTQPCSPHVHWGALGMAGYPPRKRGYLKKKAPMMRRLATLMVKEVPAIDPVLYVLVPASVFSLWPLGAHPGDADAIATLIARVLRYGEDMAVRRLSPAQADIDGIAADWLATSVVSPYFLERFTKQRSVWNGDCDPPDGRLIEPEGFGRLSCRQASMIVGALAHALGADSD